MDEHIMFNKEDLLFKKTQDKEKEGKKEDKFIWSYVLRPVRRNNSFKWNVKSVKRILIN